MFASARPSSLGNAGADFVSSKVFPMFVERNTFMPKNGLQLEAAAEIRRVAADVAEKGAACARAGATRIHRTGLATERALATTKQQFPPNASRFG
jgi:hypothetical protein